MISGDDGQDASDYAFGPCAVCGAETRGSSYWSGIGPSPMFFTPGINKPFCSAACSEAFKNAQREETPSP